MVIGHLATVAQGGLRKAVEQRIDLLSDYSTTVGLRFLVQSSQAECHPVTLRLWLVATATTAHGEKDLAGQAMRSPRWVRFLFCCSRELLP
jgi:hypothetical protein